MKAQQLAMDLPADPTHLYPVAASIHVGVDLEGYGGRALPRRRHILGVLTEGGTTRLIYRERRGRDDIFDVMHLPADTPVDIAPTY